MTRRSRNLCRSGWAFSFLALALFLLGLVGVFHFHVPEADALSHACAVCAQLQGSAHATVRASAAPVYLPSLSRLSAFISQRPALKVSLSLSIGRAPPA